MALDRIQLRPQGLYCPAGDFYIDPMRPVARAVITHAHGDHARGGSEHYIAASAGKEILMHRVPCAGKLQSLGYGEEIALGQTRVSLFPAGHVLGSAQVAIDFGEERWVVSGDYKRAPDPTCRGFESVPCDVFVTECTFGLPVYRWQNTHEIVEEVCAWWEQCASEDRTAVLFCYALGKAQRLLAELGRRSARTIYLHGAMTPLVEAYRRCGIAMAPTEPVSALPRTHKFPGALVLAPPSAAGSPWMRRFPRHSTALASGWMRIRGNRRRRGYDRGFILSDHADWPALLQSIRESGAGQVIAMHGNTEALIGYLRESGISATSFERVREGQT